MRPFFGQWACLWLGPVAMLIADAAGASRVQYDILFTDTVGDSYSGIFFVEDADLSAQPSIIDVYDFEAAVHGTFYSNTYETAQNPMPGVTGYGTNGELVTIEPPYVHSEGQPTTVNLRLLRDGTWIRDACIPLPECNPDHGSGTYTLTQVPEPSTAALFALGVIGYGLLRSETRLRRFRDRQKTTGPGRASGYLQRL